MSAQTGEIRAVAWSEVFPWLMIFRALRLATSAPILLVATVAVLLLPLGWQAAAHLAGEPAAQGPHWVSIPAAYGPSVPSVDASHASAPPSLTLPGNWHEFVAPMCQVLPGGVQPVRQLFRIDASWNEWAYFALGTFWNFVVWAFFGAIIVRTSVMQFGRGERVGLVDAAQFAAKRYAAFVGAPLFPLAGVAVIVLCSFPSAGCCVSMWESCRPRSSGSSS